MSYIGIGSPIPDISSLPGQTGGEVEVTLDYPSSSACGDASPFLPSEATPPGGVFSSSPAGLNLNTSTGEVTPVGSTPQTYTISYTVSGIISQFALTINVVQQSTFSYSSSSFQQIGTATPTLAGGTTLGGSFSAPAGVSINTSTGVIDLAASTIGGPYTITYTTPGPCASASTFDISVTAVAVELIDNNFAIEFDAASSQYINAGNNIPSLYSGAFSVSYWVKQDTISGNQHHIMIPFNQSSWVSPYVRLLTRVNGSGRLEFRAGEWNNVLYTANGAITAGNWFHVCCTFDGTTNADSMKIYINAGTPVTHTSTLASIPTSTNDLFLGTRYANGANEGLNGSMDEVAIWSKALELADVQRIYNATNDNPGKCANLFTAGLGTDLVLWNRMGD